MEDLKIHLGIYVSVNVLAGLVWWLATPATFYWPVVVHAVWGAGLLLHVVLARQGRHASSPAKGYRASRRVS